MVWLKFRNLDRTVLLLLCHVERRSEKNKETIVVVVVVVVVEDTRESVLCEQSSENAPTNSGNGALHTACQEVLLLFCGETFGV